MIKSIFRYLIDSSFQGVNRLFVLSFENEAQRTSYKRYYLPTVEIKDYNVMIDGQNFFDHPLKNNLRTYDSIRKITIGEGDDCTTGCLLDYNYFEKYYKMIATDLSKQQALDADPKPIQQINFTGNLENNAVIFFIIEEAKKNVLDFSQVLRLRKTLANNSLANIKLQKPQLHEIGQSGGFLGRLLGPLLETGFTLMEKCT